LLALYLFCSCEQPTVSTEIVKDRQDTVFLRGQLKKFKTAHSNWDQNEVKQEEVNAIFTDSVNSWKNQSDFLKGMVFQLNSADKYTDNGEVVYAATFHKSAYDGDSLAMDILGIVNKSDVDKLTNNKHYNIQGNIIKTLDRKPGLAAGYYDLGAYRFKITGFKQTD